MPLFVSAELNYGLARSGVSVFGVCLYQIVSLVMTDGLNEAARLAACARRPAEMKAVLTDPEA